MSEANYKLSELQEEIKNILDLNLKPSYLVTAEISSIQISSRGHAYLELIEKNETNDTLKAKARAIIWASTFRMIKPYFESVTGETLKTDMKIQVAVKVNYNHTYGMTLEIFDINPEFTLGDLARQRLEIIKQLKEDGVMDMNKQLEIPLVPQNVAIISSETAAGLEDFIKQLQNNQYNFRFNLKLFPSIMQGNEAPESIINALDSIFNEYEKYDLVAIIRGGGAKTDLACFDNYELALNISQFPLPIITGIGHERDFSISDMVANQNLKTPTATAEFLISCFINFHTQINELQSLLTKLASNFTNTEKEKLNILSERLKFITQNKIQLNKNIFENINTQLLYQAQNFIKRKQNKLTLYKQIITEKTFKATNNELQKLMFKEVALKNASLALLQHEKLKLENISQKIKAIDPKHILQRGFSYTMHNGKIVKNASALKNNDEITTVFYKGTAKSIIKK